MPCSRPWHLSTVMGCPRISVVSQLSSFLCTCRDEKDRDISLFKSRRRLYYKEFGGYLTLFLPSAMEDSVLESADYFRLRRGLLGIPESQVPEFRG